MELTKRFEDCYVISTEHKLTIGNSKIERAWGIENGVPMSLSLKNKKSNVEWFARKDCYNWPSVEKPASFITLKAA